MEVVVLGGGESGCGAARLAKKLGYSVFLSEKGAIKAEYRQQLVEAQIPYEEGGHTESKVLAAQLLIKSPGIPETVSLVQQAQAANIEVIDELLFAYRQAPAHTRYIAITGTNGKTTTTLLTYHILRESGLSVGLAGNVGQSLAAQLAEGYTPDWWVLEVSSFQLDGMPGFRPNIAVITNITPDHLDRYQYQLNNYIRSKFQLGLYQTSADTLILNLDDKILQQAYSQFKLPATLSVVSNQPTGSQGAQLQGRQIYFYPEAWSIDLTDTPLKGQHNQANLAAASLAALSAGISSESIRQAVQSFSNAPHRMEEVASVGGVRYVNDSKATNVDAAWYALDAENGPIVWIAGGVDKGNDYSQLDALIRQRVKCLVCLGVDNRKLVEYFGPKVPHIEEARSMKEAVEVASRYAKPGQVVLLSPCCASFDLFKNYEDRGTQFREEVLILKKEEVSE